MRKLRGISCSAGDDAVALKNNMLGAKSIEKTKNFMNILLSSYFPMSRYHRPYFGRKRHLLRELRALLV